MKRRLCALMLMLMLVLPGTARAEAQYVSNGIERLTAQSTPAPTQAAPSATSSAAPSATVAASPMADEDDDTAIYKIYDEQGNYLTSKVGRVYVDDEYISGDNKLYKIISVDDKNMTAVAQLIGDEDMGGLFEDTVATIASDSKKLVAIYSTHSDESYVPTDGTESKTKDAGIYDVDEALKSALEERGIEVELDTTTHLPHDAGAYRRSRSTAAKLLKQQPAALIDVHRDGIPNPDEYVQKIEGENATKVRLLVGKSNPNASANRKFAKQIKSAADDMYPDLIKDIYIGKGDYNQELMPRAILLEFGTHTISKERAIKSTQYMADVLDKVLFGTTAKAAGAEQENKTTGTTNQTQATNEEGGSGALWGILWVVGIAIVAIIVYGLVTTGSFSGMWDKIKRGTSETTGGLFGKKKDKDK